MTLTLRDKGAEDLFHGRDSKAARKVCPPDLQRRARAKLFTLDDADTILVYAVVLHFRWIKPLRSVWLNSAASMAAISSVVMTYFGVNYYLSGLHSYGSGDPIPVPEWVYIGIGVMVALIAVSGIVNKTKSWGPSTS